MPGASPASLRARVDELLWYHTIDVGPGVTTKGWFDLRHALDDIPFPDVTEKRCLDIGTWDGFYAFELERRGAAEVVALDVPDLAGIDYPPEVLADPSFVSDPEGKQPRSAGFHLLHELLDSSVQLVHGNIYDLDPAELGTFDLVVVGSLLVHLRDPVRALDAVRRVTDGHLLSVDYIHPSINALAMGRPLFELRGESADFQWWLASDAGYRHLLHVGGFEEDRRSDYFLLRPGPGGGPGSGDRTLRAVPRRLLNRVLAGEATPGAHLHRAYLTHPRF